MINLRLDLYKCDIHPQEKMKELGVEYESAESRPMGDDWIFYNCSNVPETLPNFLSVTNLKKEFNGKFLNGLNGEVK